MFRWIICISVAIILGACNDPVHAPQADKGLQHDLVQNRDARADSPPGVDRGLKDLTQDHGKGDSRPTDRSQGDQSGADGKISDGGSCTAEVAALVAKLNMNTKACTVAIRLDYQTLTPLGYQVFCDAYRSVSEQDARATAQSATGFGAGGQMLNTPNPEETYVFYESPGDFGGAAAVSAQTGLALFGGSVVWMGNGDITYPSSWEPASQLGAGCPTVGNLPVALGYNLNSGQSLSTAEISAALAQARQTAAPAAIWQQGYLFSTVVLLYPRSVGAFDPSSAEWIVLLNGGWLE